MPSFIRANFLSVSFVIVLYDGQRNRLLLLGAVCMNIDVFEMVMTLSLRIKIHTWTVENKNSKSIFFYFKLKTEGEGEQLFACNINSNWGQN